MSGPILTAEKSIPAQDIIQIAKCHFYESEPLARYLDTRQALNVSEDDRLSSAIVLARCAITAPGKETSVGTVTVASALKLVDQSLDALASIAPKHWDSIGFDGRNQAHYHIRDSFIKLVGADDGSCTLKQVTSLAAKMDHVLGIKGITGDLSFAK